MKLTPLLRQTHDFKLAVVGAGAGGLSLASNFSRRLPRGSVAMIEPQQSHYYQPGFTLVGGGFVPINQYIRSQASLIPRKATWFQTGVKSFDPEQNTLHLENGEKLTYEYLVIATGMSLRFDLVKGLPEALEHPGIFSIYDPKYAPKASAEIKAFNGGKAVFTFPATPIKCPGAPQKIMYIAEDRFRRRGIRDKCDVSYHTSLPRLFGIDEYREVLERLCAEKGISYYTRRSLAAVDAENRIATFDLIDEKSKPTGKTVDVSFDMLHVGPPCSPVKPLLQAAQNKSPLVDSGGWVAVHPQTLQSPTYNNIFAIGDCSNSPNSKTAAAISSQYRTLKHNIADVMNGKQLTHAYDGYASCPLVVSVNRAIFAEFNSSGPMETFPFCQKEPTYIAFAMKRYFMSFLYWNFLVKGYWNGPKTIRTIFGPLKRLLRN